jgi:dienelactone hydrolase
MKPFLLTVAFGCWIWLAGMAPGQQSPWKTTPVPYDRLSGLPETHARLPLKDLNGRFPLEPPAELAEWEQRRKRIRQDLLVSLGLWPMPPRTPLNPVVHGKVSMDGYTISKVYFESLPGFFVTGNLYHPDDLDDPAADGDLKADLKGGRDLPVRRYPGVLCPHGHFRDGRFTEATAEEIHKELAEGAEICEHNARSILQARCVHLARLGCVVFHYDMIGYADSQQISYQIAHGFAGRRPEMEKPDLWGFFSPQAELRLQSIMGLQTWNSIRALDFLISLPEVDPSRIGVTGASGGGTQTFILGAIDDRPTVAFPAVMVSTGMQGGCSCENASHLRVSAGNVDFAAAFAPRPLGLTAANDWTGPMQTDGFPQLKAIYDLYGKARQVNLTSRLEFGHNFNYVSRFAMYSWFHQHLSLKSPLIDEQPLNFQPRRELTVFNEEHPAPPAGALFEGELLRYWDQVTVAQLGLQREITEEPTLESNAVQTSASLPNAEHRQLIRAGWKSILAHPEGELSWESIDGSSESDDGHTILVRSSSHPVQTPVRILEYEGTKGDKVLIGLGLNGFRQVDPEEWKSWLDAGWKIFLPDLLYTGHLSNPENPAGQNRLVANGRRVAGYTFGYNRTVTAIRSSQIIDLYRLIRQHEALQQTDSARILLVCDSGLEGIGLLAAHQFEVGADERTGEPSAFQVSESVSPLLIALLGDQFRFGDVREFEDSMFLPGAVRYGDLPGLLQTLPAARIWLPSPRTKMPQPDAGGIAVDYFDGDLAVSDWEQVRIWARTKTER